MYVVTALGNVLANAIAAYAIWRLLGWIYRRAGRSVSFALSHVICAAVAVTLDAYLLSMGGRPHWGTAAAQMIPGQCVAAAVMWWVARRRAASRAVPSA